MNHLPQSTIRLLTSTQAVSGVSSIVKELIENSLDAASSYIEIKLVRYLIMFYIYHLLIPEGIFNSEKGSVKYIAFMSLAALALRACQLDPVVFADCFKVFLLVQD